MRWIDWANERLEQTPADAEQRSGWRAVIRELRAIPAAEHTEALLVIVREMRATADWIAKDGSKEGRSVRDGWRNVANQIERQMEAGA